MMDRADGGSGRYYGKYRGVVINNLDPEQRGRLTALVPDVLGETPSSWAMPCVPITGSNMGSYFVPQAGSGVWVEFEQGDPDYPIWVGGFWGTAAEVPAEALVGNPASPNIVVKSGGGNSIVISDLPGPTGGIVLKSTSGASVTVNDTGIYIDNGQGASIKLAGPSVNLNEGALEIT